MIPVDLWMLAIQKHILEHPTASLKYKRHWEKNEKQKWTKAHRKNQNARVGKEASFQGCECGVVFSAVA